jgi:pyruvate dehydrogenase E1 component beta subunit
MGSLTLVEAVTDALRVEMEADPTVLVFGEDVGGRGGVFRATAGLQKRFGEQRCFDTPLSEGGIVGTAIGMAVAGLKPVVEIQFSGFAYSAFNQLANHAARLRNRSRGALTVPLVLRAPHGGGIRAPEHHSECMEAMFASIRGLKVVIPSTPYDAKGLMVSAIRDVDPVVFCNYPIPSSGPEVPDEPYTVPIGEPAVRTEGTDLTIIGYAPQTAEIGRAVEDLAKEGIRAEFIDPRTLAPLEGVMPAIIESVKKTGRLLTSDEGSYSFSNCTEIVARVAEAVPGARVKRLAFPDAPAPGAPEMIDSMRVKASDIVAAAKKLVQA